MVKIIYSEEYLKHETGWHPENKARLSACVKFLKKHERFAWVKPLKVDAKDLECVHSKELVEEIRHRSLERQSTPDNTFNRETFEIALLACGGALKAARESKEEFSFALIRPPGHHAGKKFFGGFCYFNNIAFAVRKIQQEQGIDKAMIVDFDMHHGNGTQDIFYKDESVFYLSFHQNPLYTFPGTGHKRENNTHIQSVPLDIGMKDSKYVKIFEESFNRHFEDFKPGLVAISSGFDIFTSDFAVGNKMLIKKHETFNRIGAAIKGKVSDETPCFGVLEGGYDLNDLPVNLFQFLKAFA